MSKWWAGIVLGLGLIASAVGPSGCSLLNKPCPDPNSCSCPTTPNPSCFPFPDDNGDNPSTMTKRPDAGTKGPTQ